MKLGKLFQPDIKNKIIIAITIIIITFVVFMNFLIEKSYKSKILLEFQERGESIAKNLALNSADFILIDDLVVLKEMAENVKKSEKDIYFIFIVDSNKDILVHTFKDEFPRDLLFLLSSSEKASLENIVFDSDVGLIYDIKAPILKGEIGSVHVGLSDKRINNAIREMKRTLYKISFIIWLFGMILIYYITKRILAPLGIITETVKKIKPEEIEKFAPFEFKSDDEVGILAKYFNMMMKNLANMQINLKDAQHKLIQAAKFSSIGHFAAGLAHEINNPLSGILNAVHFMLNRSKMDNADKKYLELIHKGVIRIQNITKKVLVLAGKQQIEPKWINLNDLVKEELNFYEYKFKKNNILLKLNLKENLPKIFVDPLQIQQVILNTVKNSIDAIKNDGFLEITTDKINGYIVLEIKDNGVGITEEELEKVFNPFYTTKEIGKGVGLGISLSYQIIRNHGGEMILTSKPNVGTIVQIKLPIIELQESRRIS